MSRQYVFKVAEEVARAVAVAVVFAAGAAIYQQGVPTTRQGIISLLVGLLPVAWAALRTVISTEAAP